MPAVPKYGRSRLSTSTPSPRRGAIYIESQYFTSRRIAAALGDRLQEAHGPEVIIVGPAACSGWLGKTVGVLRNRFVQRLQEA